MADPFEFADGLVKQLLTLAVASIGGIIAIFENSEEAGMQLAKHSPCLPLSLGFLALSIAAGILALGGLTGQLGRTDGAKPDINHIGIRLFTMLQMFFFLGGVVALVVEVILS